MNKHSRIMLRIVAAIILLCGANKPVWATLEKQGSLGETGYIEFQFEGMMQPD